VDDCSDSCFPPSNRRKSFEAKPGSGLLLDPASFELLALSDRTTPLWKVLDWKAFGDSAEADLSIGIVLRWVKTGRHAAQHVGHSCRLI
jgi:hypothetical protein